MKIVHLYLEGFQATADSNVARPQMAATKRLCEVSCSWPQRKDDQLPFRTRFLLLFMTFFAERATSTLALTPASSVAEYEDVNRNS